MGLLRGVCKVACLSSHLDRARTSDLLFFAVINCSDSATERLLAAIAGIGGPAKMSSAGHLTIPKLPL